MSMIDIMWILSYPLALVVILGLRLVSAHQSNLQISRKVARASYWGEYADQMNDADMNEIPIPSTAPAPYATQAHEVSHGYYAH